jgi:hypothetical protein
MRVLSRYDVFFLTLYTLISSAVFFYILYNQIPSDIGAHTQILISFLEMGSFPTPPLYYSLVYGLHFIMPYKEGFGLAAWAVLTAAAFLKYLWSLQYLKTYCLGVKNRYLNPFAFGLMFFAPLTLFAYEGEYWYLGKFTSLIWHNSTSLLSLPFCILLFYFAVQYLESRRQEILWKILTVSIIIVMIKPSFIFAFLPAFPLSILLLDRKWSVDLSKSLALGVPLVVLIIVEKILIYNVLPLEGHLEQGLISGVGIQPFMILLHYSESLSWDVVSSFFFPFVFILFKYKQLFKDPHFLFSSILVLGAVAIYFTVVETGSRMMDGNFYWQVILTLFVSYLVLCKHLLISCFGNKDGNLAHLGLSVTNKFLLFLFVLHIVGGISYTGRIVITHSIL